MVVCMDFVLKGDTSFKTEVHRKKTSKLKTVLDISVHLQSWTNNTYQKQLGDFLLNSWLVMSCHHQV